MRIAIAVLAALVLGPAAHAAPDRLRQPPTEAGVLATEAAWISALAGRDLVTLNRLLAPDFVDTGWRGARRDKGAYINGVAANGAQPIALSDISVALYGDTAVARGLNTVRGQGGAVRARIRFTDIFVYRAGLWQAVSAQETLEQP
ncbi:MAG TPA: nuclear transport factor 2 family protein [Phenylobacterium sp.]|jgi:hypothetical protein